jgi:hypothetical protein
LLFFEVVGLFVAGVIVMVCVHAGDAWPESRLGRTMNKTSDIMNSKKIYYIILYGFLFMVLIGLIGFMVMLFRFWQLGKLEWFLENLL